MIADLLTNWSQTTAPPRYWIAVASSADGSRLSASALPTSGLGLGVDNAVDALMTSGTACTWAEISQRLAAARPTTSLNGTGPIGRL